MQASDQNIDTNRQKSSTTNEYKIVSRADTGSEPTGFQPEKARGAEGSVNTNVVVVAEWILPQAAMALKKATVQPAGE